MLLPINPQGKGAHKYVHIKFLFFPGDEELAQYLKCIDNETLSRPRSQRKNSDCKSALGF